MQETTQSYRVDLAKTAVYRYSSSFFSPQDYHRLEQLRAKNSSKILESFKTQISRCPQNIECSPPPPPPHTHTHLSADAIPKIGSFCFYVA